MKSGNNGVFIDHPSPKRSAKEATIALTIHKILKTMIKNRLSKEKLLKVQRRMVLLKVENVL